MEEDNLTTDPNPLDPDEGTYTYPAPEDKRMGVSTDFGTEAEETDQGDEEITREQTGIPD